MKNKGRGLEKGFLIGVLLGVLVVMLLFIIVEFNLILNLLGINNKANPEISTPEISAEVEVPAQINVKNLESQTLELWKPVIYLYPEKAMDVTVHLDYEGELIADYPDYDYSIKGWDIFAYPNGRLINKSDNKEYSYLFWEGSSFGEVPYNLDKGFVVKGEDSKTFLQEILSTIGLKPSEYNELIVFWYPRMKDNEYNLIHFAGKEYTESAPLYINPSADSLLRVFMVFKPLSEKIELEPQSFEPFIRKGFTVVEWGGVELK